MDYGLFQRYARYRLGSDAVYVEIGAGTGSTAIANAEFLSLDPGRCHLVEACPENFRVLQSKSRHFRTYNYAISECSGQVHLYVVDKPHYEGTSGSNSIDERSLRTKTRLSVSEVTVPALRMNDFFEEAAICRCDFLYMNCEGAEYRILRGDTTFLKRVFLFYLQLHKGLYGLAKTSGEMVEAKLAIYDLLESNGFVRIGGHNRNHVMEIENLHLSSFWENESFEA
ncbi:MAG: FkbM family methyltransferase [Acidobacteria bacterium]|nr:FkbM family methyltransferase [Acidobacteriota bacterium]